MPQAETSKKHETIRQLIVFILYALLATPLLLSSRFFFPFISTKTFYFRLLVEIALVLYVLLASSDARFRPSLNKLSLAVLVYLGIHWITSLAGVNFYRSFWGNTERGEGLLTFSHVIAYFVILIGMMKSERSWERYFTFSVVVSLLSAFYATFQKMGASFVVPGDVSRISALIGNASFYAGYLVSNIYIALWLALRAPGPWKKFFFWGVIVYELIILNATRTRGALLAILLGFVILMLAALFTSARRRLKYAAVVGLVLFVLFGFSLYGLRNSEFIKRTGGFERLTQIERGDVTTESRLLTWEASWKGWKDRFFTGYGYENFNVAFNKYFPAKIFRDSGSQIWFDRAHDIFFDVAVASGIFGIGAYLALFLISFWTLWRYYRQDPIEHKMTSAIFFTLLISYFLQNLFVFDTLGTYISFYSVLAFLVFIQAQSKINLAPPRPQPKMTQSAVSSINPLLALGLAIALIFVSYVAVIKPARANTKVTRALVTAAQGQFQETLDFYKEILALNTYINEEARQKLAETVINFRASENVSLEAKNRAFRFAIEEMEKALAASPLDARNHLFLMAVYNNSPTASAGTREEVIRLGREALKLSPTRPQIYFEMGQAAHALGRFDEGISYFKKAVELNPAPAESHWNLALALFIAGRMEEGSAELDFLYTQKKISKISDNNLRNLISILDRAGQPRLAVRIFQTLIDRRPQEAKLRAEAAANFAKFCAVEEAAVQTAEAVRLDPSFAEEAEAFLRQLEQQC